MLNRPGCEALTATARYRAVSYPERSLLRCILMPLSPFLGFMCASVVRVSGRCFTHERKLFSDRVVLSWMRLSTIEVWSSGARLGGRPSVRDYSAEHDSAATGASWSYIVKPGSSMLQNLVCNPSAAMLQMLPEERCRINVSFPPKT